MKQREGDQPLPTANQLPFCQDVLIDRILGSYYGPRRPEVIADIEARKQLGIKRYGTALQPHNGRDFLRDLYEEVLDSCIYGEGAIQEAIDSGLYGVVASLKQFHNAALRYAFYLKHLMSQRLESQNV